MVGFNITYFREKHYFLKICLYICQAFFAIVILFIVGIYYNNQYEQNTVKGYGKSLDIEIGDVSNRAQYVDILQIQDEFMNIFSKYENIIKMVSVEGDAVGDKGKMEIRSNFSIKNGRYLPVKSKLELYVQGRFFNVDDMNSGEKVCIIPVIFAENHHETFDIYGPKGDVEYKVIAYQNKEIDEKSNIVWGKTCFIPFKSLGPEEKIYSIGLRLTRPLMKAEYNDIKDKVYMYWGKKAVVSEYIAEDFDDEAVKNTINYVIVLVGALASITMCAIYYYMIVSKMKANAIKVLCGCSVEKLIARQIVEIVVCILINSIIGGFIYFKLLFNFLLKEYTWFPAIYSQGIVIKNLSEYQLIIMVICSAYVIYVMKKEPVEILRSARKI